MTNFRPNIVSISNAERPVLELDKGGINPSPNVQKWQTFVEEITSKWVSDNQYGGTGTLWMWQSHSQRFHANGISIFISQCGLPSRFLKFLQHELTRHFGNRLQYGGTMVVHRNKGWRPLIHVQNEVVWKPRDTVNASWIPHQAAVIKNNARHIGI